MNDNHPTDSQAKELLNKTPEETNCYKALHCLNIAVESSVADDVSEKVKAYINQLQAERDALKVEYESRAIWIRTMCDIIGYNNDDGFHSTPDPFDIAKRLVEAQATNPKPPEVAGMKKAEMLTQEFLERIIKKAKESNYGLDDEPRVPINFDSYSDANFESAASILVSAFDSKYNLISVFKSGLEEAYLAGQAASEKDKKRVDWIQSQIEDSRSSVMFYEGEISHNIWVELNRKKISSGQDVRQAIDQALTPNNAK